MAVLTRRFSKTDKSLTDEQLATLNDDQRLNIIQEHTDSDLIERVAVGFTQAKTLIELCVREDLTSVHKPLRTALANLVDQHRISFDHLKNQLDDWLCLAEVAGYSQDKSIPKLLIAQIEDQSVLTRLAEHGGTAQIRKLAAEHIQKQDLLEDLLKKTRGRDKTVYRICKDNLDRLKQDQADVQQQNQQTQELVEQFEKHAESAVNPLYGAKLQHLEEQWQQVQEQAAPEYLKRADQAIHAAQNKWQRSQSSEDPSSDTKSSSAMHGDRQHIYAQVTQMLARLIQKPDLNQKDLDEAQHQLASLQQEWKASDHKDKADRKESRHFSHLCTEFELSLDHLESQGSFTGLLDKAQDNLNEHRETLDQMVHHMDIIPESQTPSVLKKARQILHKNAHREGSKQHQQQQAVQQIRGLIRKADWAIKQGHLRQASGIMNSLNDKKLSFHNLPRFLDQQIHNLHKDLEQLRDWQSYAVEPKKRTLINRMKELIGSEDHPDHLAKTIRKLQQDWKELSRGGKDQHQSLWEEFHQAAQDAYEPCKKYFKEQSQFRKENLKKRKTLIQQLELLLNELTDDSDWKALDQAQHLARKEWRAYSPVERAANKPLQARFDELMQSIQQRLQVHYQHSKDIKEELIEQARVLLALENIVEATEKAKDLQHEWKNAGRTWRQEEQTLWKAFRGICDELFERRDQEFKDRSQHQQDHADQLLALCELAEQLSEQTPFDIESAHRQLKKLTKDYQAISELPRDRQKELQGRWHKARLKVRKRLEQEHRLQENQEWQNADDIVACITTDELTDALNDRIQQLHIPETVRHALTQLSQGQPGEHAELSDVCIQLELMAGIDGPDSEQEQRMSLQVERLQHRLMEHENQRDMFEKLMVQWFSQNQDRSAWLERFQRARSAWLDQQG